MFRLLFVMVTTVLVGLGSGYFLWGSRVARMTESLSGLTLELDTMRAKMAAAPRDSAEGGSAKAGDDQQLRVINESVAALRVELAEQKALIEKSAAATPTDAAAVGSELKTARNDLAACMADKQDLEVRCSAPAPSPVPGTAPTYQAPRYRPALPAPAAPSAVPSPVPGGADPRY